MKTVDQINNIKSGLTGATDKSALTDEEKIFNELFSPDQPPTEEEKKEHIKMLRQRGFQISKVPNAAIELETEISYIRDEAEDYLERWNECVTAYLDRISVRRAEIAEIIDVLEEPERRLDREESEHRESRRRLKAELDNLKLQLTEVRQKFSLEKKGIGDRLIIEAELELKKLTELQERVYNSTKTINEDRFRVLEDTLRVIISKYETLRESYIQRFEGLQEKVKALGGDGINMGTAYTLLSIGSATAGVAGYFFSIFSSYANYSGSDVFYYLLRGVVEAIAISGPVAEKIYYFLGTLAVITLVGWGTDVLVKRMSFYRKNEDDVGGHFFATEFKSEGLSYRFSTREKTWFILWLKILPLILVVGSLLMLISLKDINSVGSDTNSDKINALSASTEGLLIGTAIAMAMGGLYYLYLVKVAERRQERKEPGSIKHSWELAVAILILLLSLSLFAFFPSNVKDPFENIVQKTLDVQDQLVNARSLILKLSIAGFIGTTIATGVVFSYGLRFFGLLSSQKEVQEIIMAIDDDIAVRSVPRQQFIDAHVEEYFDKLSEGLLLQLEKKNEAILDPEKQETIRMVPEQTGKKKKIGAWRITKNKNKVKSMNIYGQFDMLEWEITYFPEYAESIKLLAAMHEEKQRELVVLDEKIKQCQTDKAKLIEELSVKKKELQQKSDELSQLYIKAKGLRIIKDKELRRELKNDIVHVLDGYDLGLWYQDQDAATPNIPIEN